MALDPIETSVIMNVLLENCSDSLYISQDCINMESSFGSAAMSAMTHNLTALNATADGLVHWESLMNYLGIPSANESESSRNGSIDGITPAADEGSEVEEKKSILISKEIRDIIIIINMAILCQAISVFGVFANLVNIAVFIKQGFRDAMTVTLTGLAVADLGISACAVWLSICYNPLFQQLELPFLPLQIVYLTAGLPRLSCSRVSSWVLALATFERCLCIAMPFKVREIISPRRSLIFVISAFFVMTASVAPTYYTTRTAQKFDEAANRSYLVLSFTEDRQKIDSIAFGIGVSLSVCSFVAVAVCTVVLVYSLNKTSKWRESAIGASGKDQSEKNPNNTRAVDQVELSTDDSEMSTKVFSSVSEMADKDYRPTPASNHSSTARGADVKKKTTKEISAKNKRAGKMVSLISIIFIVCYLPNTLNQLNGRYINTNQVFWSVGFVTESINASVNIFMYYTMSTKFRSTIQGMMCAFCRRPGDTSKAAADDDDDDPKQKKTPN
ncbi:chemosensory receptor b [Plakobranchus ocellatus]|uniref:Chemosensory receptor b n=1 Tax=Plakobranchus ocellatus TaxID=259542 RepID=A0AAV4D369_9GAST|nr:chemosensory receptor b [Plakobranchus ocellatus]